MQEQLGASLPDTKKSWTHQKIIKHEISLTLIAIKFSSQVEAQDIHYT
jgi:hypothetical protein